MLFWRWPQREYRESVTGTEQIHLNLSPHYSEHTSQCRRQFIASRFSSISLCLAYTLPGMMWKNFLCTDHFITNISTYYSCERSYNYTQEFKWSLNLSEALTLASIIVSPRPCTITKTKWADLGHHPMEAMTASGCERGLKWIQWINIASHIGHSSDLNNYSARTGHDLSSMFNKSK